MRLVKFHRQHARRRQIPCWIGHTRRSRQCEFTACRVLRDCIRAPRRGGRERCRLRLSLYLSRPYLLSCCSLAWRMVGTFASLSSAGTSAGAYPITSGLAFFFLSLSKESSLSCRLFTEQTYKGSLPHYMHSRHTEKFGKFCLRHAFYCSESFHF